MKIPGFRKGENDRPTKNCAEREEKREPKERNHVWMGISPRLVVHAAKGLHVDKMFSWMRENILSPPTAKIEERQISSITFQDVAGNDAEKEQLWDQEKQMCHSSPRADRIFKKCMSE